MWATGGRGLWSKKTGVIKGKENMQLIDCRRVFPERFLRWEERIPGIT